jgi:hypothetical protein
MRYSEIITGGFYKIGLTDEEQELADAHFLTAAHHRLRFAEAEDPDSTQFHLHRYWHHVRALLAIAAMGDFAVAFDPSRRGLERPEGWNPGWTLHAEKAEHDLRLFDPLLPDPHMFDKMAPDFRFKVGQTHPYDELVDRPERLREITTRLLESGVRAA